MGSVKKPDLSDILHWFQFDTENGNIAFWDHYGLVPDGEVDKRAQFEKYFGQDCVYEKISPRISPRKVHNQSDFSLNDKEKWVEVSEGCKKFYKRMRASFMETLAQAESDYLNVAAGDMPRALRRSNQISLGDEKKSPEKADLRLKEMIAVVPVNSPVPFPGLSGLETSRGDPSRDSISNAPMLTMKPNANHPEKKSPQVSLQKRFNRTQKMLKRLETQNADAEDTSCVVTKNQELPPQRQSIGPGVRQNSPEQDTLGLRVSSVPTLILAVPANFQESPRQISPNQKYGMKGGVLRQIAQNDGLRSSSKNDQSESNAIRGKNFYTFFGNSFTTISKIMDGCD